MLNSIFSSRLSQLFTASANCDYFFVLIQIIRGLYFYHRDIFPVNIFYCSPNICKFKIVEPFFLFAGSAF